MAMAYGPSQQSSDAGRSNLSSAMWSTSRNGLLQLTTFFVCRPQKLKPHSRRIFVSLSRFSSPERFQPISNNPSSPCHVFREKTCLEFTSPSSTPYRIAERWVCAGGGKRPRKPRIWRTRHRRGSFSKSDSLLQCLEPLSNVKEEVYGALDGFIAWELDFPLVAVKKALYVLEGQQKWIRIIQVVKWMLGKGQGRSLGTYQILLRAFSEEGRTDEAQELWKKVFSRNLECTPLKLCVEIMRMYKRHEMYEDLLEVFADMEELNMKLNDELADIVSDTYEKLGFMDKAEKVKQKYATPKFRYRHIDGKTVKFSNYVTALNRGVSRWSREDQMNTANPSDSYLNDLDGKVGVSRWSSENQMKAANPSDAYINGMDGKVEKEDWRDYRTQDDEGFQTEEGEEFQTEGDEEDFRVDVNEEERRVDMGHFQSRQFAGNDVYT